MATQKKSRQLSRKIERAAGLVGGYTALAERAGIPRSTLYRWRKNPPKIFGERLQHLEDIVSTDILAKKSARRIIELLKRPVVFASEKRRRSLYPQGIQLIDLPIWDLLATEFSENGVLDTAIVDAVSGMVDNSKDIISVAFSPGFGQFAIAKIAFRYVVKYIKNGVLKYLTGYQERVSDKINSVLLLAAGASGLLRKANKDFSPEYIDTAIQGQKGLFAIVPKLKEGETGTLYAIISDQEIKKITLILENVQIKLIQERP